MGKNKSTFQQMTVVIFALAILSGLGGCYGRGTDEADQFAPVATGPVNFQTVNAEIFQPLCSKCHGKDHWFDSEHALLSHSRLIVPGMPTASEILAKVEDGSMPQGGPRLSEAQCDLISRYISGLKATAPAPTPTPTPSASPSPLPPNPHANYTWLSTNLFQASCMGCHSTATHKKNVILDTYDGAVKAGMDIYNEIDTGDMPPDDAGKPAVTDDAKAALLEWIQTGFPENPDSSR